MRKKKGLIWLGILTVIIITGVSWAIITYDHNASSKPTIITATVETGNVEKSVVATGVLEPYKMVSVGAQTSGRVTSLKVDLGDYVEKGSLIAEIDSESQQNALQTANARIADVHAQIEQATTNLALAKRNYDRQKSLYAQDAASKLDLDSAKTTYNAQSAALKSLNAQLTEAQITHDDAELNLGYTKITAPISGNVLAIVTKEGQTINANQTTPTIVKLGQTDRMTIQAEISEADVIHVKPGMNVYFTTLGAPNRQYKATLRSVAPAPVSVETTDTLTPSTNSNAIYYNGVFDVDNEDGSLRTFMTAQVNIILQSAENVTTIPSTALGKRNADGTYKVKVLADENHIAMRNIKTGVNDGTNVQVTDGLAIGEKVVIVDATNRTDTNDFKGRQRLGGL